MRRLRPKAFWRGASGVSATAKAALLVGILTSLLVAAIIFAQARSSAHEVAELRASDIAATMKQRIGLSRAYLRATAARFRGDGLPTREEFTQFADSLGPQPIVDALMWLPVVPAGERARFEQVLLPADGAAISDLRATGERTTAGNRPLYLPVGYFAGDERLNFLRGVDFLGNEDLRETIARASTTGRMALSAPLGIADREFVVLLFPVEPGRQSETGGQALVGAALSTQGFGRGSPPRPVKPGDLRIVDVTEPEAPRAVSSPADAPAPGQELVSAEVELGGRRWLISVTPSYADAYELAGLTLLGGLVLTGLIGLFADRGHHLLIADDLQRAVDRQTAALQRSTAEFRALFEEGGAGKCELVPGSGHFRRVNLRLCQMLGFDRNELEGMTFNAVLDGGATPEPAFRELLRGERDSYFAEHRFHTRDGDTLWGEVSATVLRDGVGRAVWIVVVVQDVTPRKQAEEARQLLVRELAHRVKNTLQLARSLADQTARYVKDLPSFMTLYQSRLHALATAHDQLFKTSWAGADLQDLVLATLDPYTADDGDDRIEIDVPPHRLSSAETQTIALLVNELATNACKHGALCEEGGRIRIRARIEAEEAEHEAGAEQLVFEWEEDAARPIEKPEKRGFGMTFLTRAIAHQHDGTARVDWGERGMTYRFVIPLHPAETAADADAA